MIKNINKPSFQRTFSDTFGIIHLVIPAQGVAGVSHSMLCACVTVGLCRSQRALQGGIQSRFKTL
jgi:hypothetical protein